MFLYPILIVLFLKHDFIPIIISAFLLGILLGEVVAYDIYFNLHYLDFFPYINPKANTAYPTPFMTHLNYGLFLAFSAGLSLQLFFQKKTYLIKIFSILLMLSITTNLLINTGRSGYILFIVSVSIILFLQYKKKIIKYIPLLLITFLSIFTLAYNISPNFHKKALQTVHSIKKLSNSNYNSSIGIRLLNYNTSLELFSEKPLFGYGTEEHVRVLYEKTKQSHPSLAKQLKYYSTTDSQYFDVALQFGLVGLFVLFNIFYQIYRYPYTDSYLKNISILTIILFTLYGIQTNFMHFLNPSSILLIFFSSLILINHQDKSNFNIRERSFKLHSFDFFSLILLNFIAFQIYRLFI